mgnify:CR=1 FL=1
MMVWLTIPGEPQGKGRHRAVRRGDHIATYTPRKTKDYEDEVRFCYRQAYGDRMAFAVDEPISATIVAAFGIPKSSSKKRKVEMMAGRGLPTKKPDTDNIAKIVLDALNGLAYPDDKQVVELHVIKEYDLESCVTVELTPWRAR